jgi:hypothetical protein
VISDSNSSCFAGEILFCASVATRFPSGRVAGEAAGGADDEGVSRCTP